MKVVTFADIASLNVDPALCVQWVEEALSLKYESVLPKKISMKLPELPGVFYNCMPCLVPSIQRGGVKLVTRYPHREPALDAELLLYNLEDGECLALMDADWITTMRTGAVAAHTVVTLARPGWSRVGFMGLGNTARATMACLRAVTGDQPLSVGLLRYKDQADDFMARFSDLENVEFTVFDDVSALASWSDALVSCITYADGDVCPAEAFKPGALLVPVHTRGFTSCDLAFDRVFADDTGHVSGFGYFEQFAPKLTEMAQVVRGEAPGRLHADERILAYNIGVSLHDIVFAARLYELCGDQCQELQLAKPATKFWA